VTFFLHTARVYHQAKAYFGAATALGAKTIFLKIRVFFKKLIMRGQIKQNQRNSVDIFSYLFK
jgi:hypothetical protein